MFGGIIETTGICLSLQPIGGGTRLTMDAGPLTGTVAQGESVSVNGCCLTALPGEGPTLSFDLLAETLRRTNLGELLPGTPANLERSLPADGRIGGHFVQGHIDTTAEILSLTPVGADHRLEVALPPEFARYVVFKGSIAIDGISLTVAELHPDRFVVWLIPHTMRATNLRLRRPGQKVNLEFDLLAKYVERILAGQRGTPPEPGPCPPAAAGR